MIESLELSGEAAIPLLVGLVLFLGFVRIVRSPDNPIDFWHFFASYNERAGKEYGDINNLGMMVGIIACLFILVWIAYKTTDVNPWVLGLCLIYLGGVKAFASWLRMVAAKKYGAPADPPAAPPTADKREITHTTTDKTTTGG